MKVLKIKKSSPLYSGAVYVCEVTRSAIKVLDNESHISRYNRTTGRYSSSSKLSALASVGEVHLDTATIERYMTGKETWDGGVRINCDSKGKFIKKNLSPLKARGMEAWLHDNNIEVIDLFSK